jgi:hypothetical protein
MPTEKFDVLMCDWWDKKIEVTSEIGGINDWLRGLTNY